MNPGETEPPLPDALVTRYQVSENFVSSSYISPQGIWNGDISRGKERDRVEKSRLNPTKKKHGSIFCDSRTISPLINREVDIILEKRGSTAN